ncbi:MAG: efflux RND transporter periplasmic adaptor subunit [Pseudomonadota bacterium]
MACRIIIRHLFVLSLFVVLLSWAPLTRSAEHDHGSHEGENHAAEETIWTCSMHPQIQLPEFGQCPICFMDLIEVPKDSGDSERTSLRQITFDERARKIAQVEVTPVVRGNGSTETRMTGKVDYDETRLGTITAWIGGRIDKLHIDYTGSTVKKGQAMAELYSPDLLTAQAELIQAVAASGRLQDSTLDLIRNTVLRTEQASREKLRLLGLSEGQIKEVITRGKPSDHVTLIAPMSGVVITKDVVEGVYVKTGMPIYTIASLNHLWVNLEAYESDLARIKLGQKVDFSVEAFPGRFFAGKVAYIDPLVNEKTRTIRVRLNVDNSDMRLKPGMFVRARIENSGSKGELLLIPASAPLFTGKRALVYVQQPEKEGVYEGREVILGPRHGDFYQVKEGIAEGELVVSHGNFKIDSAIQIQARPSMMAQTRFAKPEEEGNITLFRSKLALLNTAFTDLSDAVHQKSEKSVDEEVKQFRAQLGKLTENELTGADKLAWKEMSMLLASDTILVAEADDEKELDRIYAVMAEHFHQVRAYFKLDDAKKIGGEEHLALQATLGKLLTSYFALQQALATDDLDKSLTLKKEITGNESIMLEELAETSIEAKGQITDDLRNSMEGLEKSSSIEAIRASFYPLSRGLALALSIFGAPGSGSIYEQFCPMAFGNTGATWLAGSNEINNPYFGAMMLRCGEVRRQLQ